MNRYKIFAAVLLITLILVVPLNGFANFVGGTNSIESLNNLSEDEIQKIDMFIGKQMRAGKIPGISVVIVNGDETIYKKAYGHADLESKRPVTEHTLFELGSTSKAFTGLGILKLEQEGLIDLNDPVRKYLPWFGMKYKDMEKKTNYDVDITIRQLLHHTSGIPSKSIQEIPIGEEDNSLEEAVKRLVGKNLDFYPGERFGYSTINYDILGLIIQEVSKVKFETYMNNNILKPLDLTNTYLFRKEASLHDFANGHKIGFLKALEYRAPMYRGNTPAAYFISNIKDMEKWLKIQLGTSNFNTYFDNLIEKSHVPNRTVAPSLDGSLYSAGWTVYQRVGEEICHSGNNPNFSSFIVFRPVEKVGVAVLANMNSTYTKNIGQGIMNMIRGNTLQKAQVDMYKRIDSTSVAIICITIPLILTTLYFIAVCLIEIFKKKREFRRSIFKNFISILLVLLFSLFFGLCLYKIPDIFYSGMTWSYAMIWIPISFKIAILSLYISIVVFSIYYLLINLFPKSKESPFFLLIVLSTISGLGNSLIIFIINEALSKSNSNTFQGTLFLMLILGITIYVYGQKVVRMKLITITNNLVYSKRIELLNKILNTSYEKMEQIENGKIQAALNNDTEIISTSANVFITGVTSLITLLCCFIYLGIINIYGLLVSMLVIIIAASMYYFAGRTARKFLEQTRDIQNVFFNFINDLIYGFKELNIHEMKRKEFKLDMQQSCDDYRKKRIKVGLKFANVFVIGELLLTFVIGTVVFIFPLMFKGMHSDFLRNYVFVFLYMNGHIRGILGAIPNIIRMRVSWNRINKLTKELSLIEDRNKEGRNEITNNVDTVSLKLKNVEYSYKGEDGEVFSIGPIDYEFNSGEITFITGGNGSGKTTLAKLITGLYTADKGQIMINDEKTDSQNLCSLYSTIFSDYYLFDKLYGVNHKNRKDEIDEYLKTLYIDNKVQIHNGKFSTIKLSSGQKKRLALLVSYLEDRPVYLFDEWAADQDPEFRNYFYFKLLPDLRDKGKCVIAITHDDAYFDTADKILKMEMGKVVESKELIKRFEV